MGYETRAVCTECWYVLNVQVPVRIKEQYRDKETCWRCGKDNEDGIFMRIFVSGEGTVQV